MDVFLRGPEYVHCLMGRDRTGLAIVAFRVRVQRWTREAALNDLDAHGYNWVMYPNVGVIVENLAEGLASATWLPL
jgi:hypothetical protein